MTKSHGERKHSKYGASSAERYFECPGSVSLSEGIPNSTNPYAEEGTKAHEVLEKLIRIELSGYDGAEIEESRALFKTIPAEMYNLASDAADFILDLHAKAPHSDLLIETKADLSFVHPEAFGSLDAAIVEHFGTLHVLDFKYGVSSVSPVKNLQLIFYALAVAFQFGWNFKNVKLWIIQPRVRGYDGPTFWELTTSELRAYVPLYKAAIRRTMKFPNSYNEGKWCHWCNAKTKCPLKIKAKADEAKMLFGPIRKVNKI